VKRKVLITETCDSSLIQGLQEMNYACDYNPVISGNEILKIIHEYFGIVIASKTKVDKEMLEKAIQLKWIARMGSGMENVDEIFCKEKKIICLSSPEGNADAVAEHAVGLLIGLLHNIPKGWQEIQQGKWSVEGNRTTELNGMTVGIIGYGHNGSAFAKRLKNFNVTILANDKFKKNFGNEFVKESSLDTIFENADVVSMHVPLTDLTYHFVNKDFIRSFHKNFYLLNISRGKVVSTIDLLDDLQSGKISGAGLDVLENEHFEKLTPEEKNTYSELFKLPNVIITPHVAGKSKASKRKFAEVLLEKIKRIDLP
jgi:D-3-phosphoglycerate dehydrogenase / 2-oxoglutarate reductase